MQEELTSLSEGLVWGDEHNGYVNSWDPWSGEVCRRQLGLLGQKRAGQHTSVRKTDWKG